MIRMVTVAIVFLFSDFVIHCKVMLLWSMPFKVNTRSPPTGL